MRSRLALLVIATVVFAAGFVLGQGRAGRTSFHVITLPTAAQVSDSVDKLMLLDTAHLELTTVLVPRGTLHTPRPAAGQLTVQALSGTGEVRMGQNYERIDGRRMLVLAPGAEHEIRASVDTDLVLLVHEVSPRTRSGLGRLGASP